MTGYGVAEASLADGRLQCEIRTVNHRHLNIQTKLPTSLQSFEDVLRALLRERLARGHVNLAARWVEEPVVPSAVAVDLTRARQVVEALIRLQRELGLGGEIDVALVARQPDVLQWGGEDGVVPEGAHDALIAVVREALEGVLGMREREGRALGEELTRLLDVLEGKLATVRERASPRLQAERDRLRAALAELLEGRTVDEERVAQEIAMLAEKLDVREEIVRLEAHCAAARETLAADEPIGRRLAFLSQEMLREVNTIGSKANDTVMSHAVVAMKGVLEQFREQIENVE